MGQLLLLQSAEHVHKTVQQLFMKEDLSRHYHMFCFRCFFEIPNNERNAFQANIYFKRNKQTKHIAACTSFSESLKTKRRWAQTGSADLRAGLLPSFPSLCSLSRLDPPQTHTPPPPHFPLTVCHAPSDIGEDLLQNKELSSLSYTLRLPWRQL